MSKRSSLAEINQKYLLQCVTTTPQCPGKIVCLSSGIGTRLACEGTKLGERAMLEGACCEAFFNVGIRDSFGKLSVGWLFANIEAGRPTMTEHRLAHQAGEGEESLRKVYSITGA